MVRRVLQVVPAVAAIVVVTFMLVHLAPGDPVEVLASEGGSPEYLDSLRAEYGLDKPLPTQLAVYASKVVRGDFGESILLGQSVTDLIGERMQPTLLLTGSALVLSSLAAVGLGVMSGRRPFGAFDTSLSAAGLVAYAVPTFWLGQIVVLILGLKLGWFPVQGFTDARADNTGLAHYLDLAHHLALPALVLATSETALLARITRAGLLADLGKGYALTARAKGVNESRIVTHHVLRNVLLPVATVIGSRVGFLVSGAVLVESVFAWPGLGSLLVDGARNQDHPVVLALVMMVAVSVVVMNLVIDLIYGRIDPRVRHR